MSLINPNHAPRMAHPFINPTPTPEKIMNTDFTAVDEYRFRHDLRVRAQDLQKTMKEHRVTLTVLLKQAPTKIQENEVSLLLSNLQKCLKECSERIDRFDMDQIGTLSQRQRNSLFDEDPRQKCRQDLDEYNKMERAFDRAVAEYLLYIFKFDAIPPGQEMGWIGAGAKMAVGLHEQLDQIVSPTEKEAVQTLIVALAEEMAKFPVPKV